MRSTLRTSPCTPFRRKVIPFLDAFPLLSRETWILLQARTLCMLRNTQGDNGEPKDQGQARAGAKEGEGRRSWCNSRRISGQRPRHPARAPRTSGNILGHPAPRQNSYRTGPRQPRHPAHREPPDIRPPTRTSDAYLRAETGQRPMYPSPTYPFVDLDYIYSSTPS